jgi:hypothetical protein
MRCAKWFFGSKRFLSDIEFDDEPEFVNRENEAISLAFTLMESIKSALRKENDKTMYLLSYLPQNFGAGKTSLARILIRILNQPHVISKVEQIISFRHSVYVSDSLMKEAFQQLRNSITIYIDLYRALQPYSPFTDIGSYAVSTC